MRSSTLLALGVLCLGCGDEASDPAPDTIFGGDTVPRLDTSSVTDSSAPPDTVAPETTAPDTSVPPDTTPVEDTTPPQDTTLVEDTAPPQDTTPVEDTAPPQDTADTSDGGTDTGPDPDPIDNGLNASWVGGACDTVSDCDHGAFNETPECQLSGFPNGFCTQACRQSTSSGAWICPDADTGLATPYTTTRCISTNGDPRCVAECDFGKDDRGCRPGYTCVLRSRHGQPNRIFPVCMPEPIQRWPGEPEPADDVGESCDLASDCAHRSCMALPNGYCTKSHCDLAGCPDGSTCYGFSGGETFCLQDCTGDGDCRSGEGYSCDVDATCWPDDNRPSWNPSVGAGDCANAWGTGGSGLSRCDTTKDDYVVLRKSARNLALCNRGALVQNFEMGLGFAPLGDKQVEGDGKTPEGVFYIPQLIPNSSYYKAFLVSYPDKEDAAWGIAADVITQAQKNTIDSAQDDCKTPPQSTGLGGWIEIHGEGGGSDWTLGCAALDNSAVDTLWDALQVRDTIVILP